MGSVPSTVTPPPNKAQTTHRTPRRLQLPEMTRRTPDAVCRAQKLQPGTFATDVAIAFCRRAGKCGSKSAFATPIYNLAREDVDLCAQFLQSLQAFGEGSSLAIGIEQGTLAYNANALQNCSDFDACETLQADRGLTNSDRPTCPDILTGRQTIGASCHLDTECGRDGYCDTGATCPGRCVLRRPLDAACERDAQCQPVSSNVDNGVETVTCRQQVCTKKLTRFGGQAGTSCRQETLNSATNSWEESICAEGLFCQCTSNQLGCPDRRCVPYLAPNAPCSWLRDLCSPGYECRPPPTTQKVSVFAWLSSSKAWGPSQNHRQAQRPAQKKRQRFIE